MASHYKFHNDSQSSVLTYEQVKRLDHVMDQIVPIHGRGNFPTLFVKLKELIRLVRHKLQAEHSIEIRDVILNGGAASYVLAPENSHYNDLDLIFGTDLSDETRFDVIRDVVLECLEEFYPKPNQSELGCTGNNSGDDSGVCECSHDSNEDHDDDDETNASASAVANTIKSDHSGDKLHSSGSRERRGGELTKDSESCDGEEHTVINEQSCDKKQKSKKQSSQNASKHESNQELDCSKESTPCKSVLNSEKISTAGNHHQLGGYPQYHHQPPQIYQTPLSNCAMKEAYVHKMVKVNDDDRWSLISLGVQQSEANCCGQANCSPVAITSQRGNLPKLNHQRFANDTSFAPIDATSTAANKHIDEKVIQGQDTNENDDNICNDTSSNDTNCSRGYQQSAAFVDCTASTALSQSHSTAAYIYQQHQDNQQNHYQTPLHQPKQFPNNIELKFVDRMRRKFEFSVDSFQIILDSLIQFYDYAPESTICLQDKLHNSHSSSTLINVRPMIINSNKKRCNMCSKVIESGGKLSAIMMKAHEEKNFHQSSHFANGHCTNYQQNDQKRSSFSTCTPIKSSCVSLLDNSRSYCQLPLDPKNSPSISSVASSSGCSSSSSVVSSSSSSLSCDDDDHEDFYCEAESPPSSSSSTSSSSTSSLLPSSSSPSSSSYDFETSNRTSCAVISENFYPTVIGRSEYGNFKEALYHLEKKLIATKSPEEIRGGGLLKYCNLLVKNYKPVNVLQIRTLERYMCSRFFIDFSDPNQQQAKLESYLANHFSGDPFLKFDYLTILHNIVQRSTVCLMNHELRLTLNMIRDLAHKLNEHHQQQQALQSMQQQVQNQSQPKQLNQAHMQFQKHHHHQQLQQPPHHHQKQLCYQQQRPVLIQSGAYRVKLVNYTLTKPFNI